MKKLCMLLFLLFLLPKLPTEAAHSESFFESVANQSPFRFVTEVIKVAEGQTVVLTCSFENFNVKQSTDPMSNDGKKNVLEYSMYNRLTWMKYDKQSVLKYKVANGEHLLPRDVQIRQRYQVFLPFSTYPLSLLLIHRVPHDLNGFYVCRSAINSLQVKVFYLQVIKPILSLLHTGEKKYFINRGDSINLSCNASSNYPSTSIYWTKRNHQDSAEEEYFLRWGSQLKIEYADANHEGLYTCHVNNYLDKALTFTYDVQLGTLRQKKPSPISATYNGMDPAFLKTSKAIIPKYGELYILSCRSNGKGINFRWFRNNTNVISGTEGNLVIHSSEDRVGSTISDLIIKKFTLTDRNRYTCEAINNVGHQRFTFILTEIRKLPTYMKQNRIKYAPRIRLIHTTDDEDLASELISGDGSGLKKAFLIEGSGNVIPQSNDSYVTPKKRNNKQKPSA